MHGCFSPRTLSPTEENLEIIQNTVNEAFMDIAKYSLLMQLMRKENIIKDVPKY